MIFSRKNRRKRDPVDWHARRVAIKERYHRHGSAIRRWGFFIGLFLVGLVVWHQGGEWFRGLPLLKVSQIDVRGVTRIAPDEAMRFSGLEEGMSMLTVDVDAVSYRLKRHPWVHRALARRVWPDHVRVDIEEYEPAILLVLGDVYMADGSGHVFRKLTSRDGLDLPVLTGLARETVETDRGTTAGIVREALILVEDARATGPGRVDEVHWDEAMGWSVVLVHDDYSRGVRVHLGKDPSKRLAGLDPVLEELHRVGRTPEIIWLDGTKHPGRVQVRLVPDTFVEDLLSDTSPL